jgi:hypothetical protein
MLNLRKLRANNKVMMKRRYWSRTSPTNQKMREKKMIVDT